MKKRLAALVFLCFASPVFAPAAAFEDAVAADPEYAMGLFIRYHAPEARCSPAPAGYKPFYISHYGRHGCRYLADARQLSAVATLERAGEAGLLTEEGLLLLEKLRSIASAHDGMIGMLTKRGASEHRAIARRMLARFPDVFDHPACVRCQASTYPRTMASMANFACEMKGLRPSLAVEFSTGERYMKVVMNNPDHDRRPYPKIREAKKKFLSSAFDPEPMMARIFTDPAAAGSAADAQDLAQSIYYMAASCRPLEIELDGLLLDGFFAPGELAALGRALNAKWFVDMGNSAEFGDTLVPAAGNLCRDIALRADEAIAAGGVAADLRFGHDAGLWPLVAWIGLEGVGDKVPFKETCDHPYVWRTMPMGSNLQIVFYRNSSGDVLVKCLYNERETPVRGLEAIDGFYYRWADLRRILLGG